MVLGRTQENDVVVETTDVVEWLAADDEGDAERRARELASSEGLTLVPGNGACGYKGVRKQQRNGRNGNGKERGTGARYECSHGSRVDRVFIGSYGSAAEAALAYARHIGPAASAAAVPGRSQPGRLDRPAHEFGVPREGSVLVATVISELDDSGEDDEAAPAGKRQRAVSTHLAPTQPRAGGCVRAHPCASGPGSAASGQLRLAAEALSRELEGELLGDAAWQDAAESELLARLVGRLGELLARRMRAQPAVQPHIHPVD